MTAALTPALALDYLRELSADLRAAIVLDAAGERLAGPPALTVATTALLAAAPGASAITARTRNGIVFAARDTRHALLAATGPLALPGLMHHDLRSVLAALGGDPKTDAPVPASAQLAKDVLTVVDSLS